MHASAFVPAGTENCWRGATGVSVSDETSGETGVVHALPETVGVTTGRVKGDSGT